MNKTDDTFLKWLEDIKLSHTHTDNGHRLSLSRCGKELAWAVHKNPFIAMMSAGGDLRSYYFLKETIENKEEIVHTEEEEKVDKAEEEEIKNVPKNKKNR